MDIAGHVSKQMLRHYSHVRMEAKRAALESILPKRTATPRAEKEQNESSLPTSAQQIATGSPRKSPQGLENEGQKRVRRGSKSSKKIWLLR